MSVHGSIGSVLCFIQDFSREEQVEIILKSLNISDDDLCHVKEGGKIMYLGKSFTISMDMVNDF